jgi:pimeloyl-ACP methyl ester carboxylesterase
VARLEAALTRTLVQVSDTPAVRLLAARAVILDNAGRMAHIDQPQRWLTAVAAFLGG